jgi:DNA-binding XRE family transcriptional regulator
MGTPFTPPTHGHAPCPTPANGRIWQEGERRILPPDVASTLQRAREAHWLTQAEAARSAQVDRSYLSRLERGTRCPSLVVARALIEALNLEPAVANRLLEIARTDAGRSRPGRPR